MAKAMRGMPRCWRFLKYFGIICMMFHGLTMILITMNGAQIQVVDIENKISVTDSTNTSLPELTVARYNGSMMVIILTYQRSGSTFLGQIFNHNPDAFYVFEPLDSLYSAIYGTSTGYNTPTDILQNWDGTFRKIPDFELRSSAAMMDWLLTCNHDRLPTEVLTSIFWYGFMSEHLTVRDYVQCLQKHKLVNNKCRSRMARTCRTWFGQKTSKQTLCRNELWDDISPKVGSNKREFTYYKNCMTKHRKAAAVCFPHLTNACTNASIRSAKVVRLSMQAVAILLQKYADRLKVLHLLRDPKAVTTSRMKYESVRGHFAGKNKTREAVTLCRTIEDDLEIRESLERRYPGVFYQIIYEDFIRDPIGMTKSIYSHIGKPLPPSIGDFLSTQTSLNNTKPISGLSVQEANAIDNVCSSVYSRIGHKWPLVTKSHISSRNMTS